MCTAASQKYQPRLRHSLSLTLTPPPLHLCTIKALQHQLSLFFNLQILTIKVQNQKLSHSLSKKNSTTSIINISLKFFSLSGSNI